MAKKTFDIAIFLTSRRERTKKQVRVLHEKRLLNDAC